MNKLNNTDYNAFGHDLRKSFNASKDEDRWNKKMSIISVCLSAIGIIPVFFLTNSPYHNLAIIGWMIWTIIGIFLSRTIIKKFWK